MGRKEYFPAQIKEEAKRRANYRCEMCGKRDEEVRQLEIHHKVAVWFAKKYFPQIASHVLNSIVNAECLCSKCHRQKHKGDRLKLNNKRYQSMAKQLESMQPRMRLYGL